MSCLAVRTCMNVIVGRRPNGSGGFVLDKFSLYYADNAAIPAEWGSTWELLQGYSFRTAALNGSLNREGLNGLRWGSVPTAVGTEFDAAVHGLVIDDASAYEDCAYVSAIGGESTAARVSRIDGMVAAMVAAYGGSHGLLALSYDPAEQAQGLTALESEWQLLKSHARNSHFPFSRKQSQNPFSPHHNSSNSKYRRRRRRRRLCPAMMTHVTLGHHPESAARHKRPYRVRAAKVRLHSLSFSHFPSVTFLHSLAFIHFAAAAGTTRYSKRPSTQNRCPLRGQPLAGGFSTMGRRDECHRYLHMASGKWPGHRFHIACSPSRTPKPEARSRCGHEGVVDFTFSPTVSRFDFEMH